MKTLLLASIGLVTAFNTPEPQGSFHVADIRKSFFVREQGVEKPSVSDFPDNTFEEIDPGLIMPPSPFKQKEEIASLQSQTSPRQGQPSAARTLRDKPPATLVQGTSVQTWTFLPSHKVERLQVDLATQGRPLDATVELWQGPENIPQKMRVYSENGKQCPFSTLIETPVGYNTLAVKNTANLEFPLGATVVDADSIRPNYSNPLHSSRVTRGRPSKRIQGNALHTYKYGQEVVSLQIVLQTDGLPMSARVELSQGPNNNKQIIDVYSQDGMAYPVSLVVETPGNGKVVRIMNTASVEYPLKAWIEPCTNAKNEEIEVLRKEDEMKRIGPSDYGRDRNGKNEKDSVDSDFQRSNFFAKRQQKMGTAEQAKANAQSGAHAAMPYFWAQSENTRPDKSADPLSPRLRP